MAISYIAIRSVDNILSCDDGNINSYQWLNSCINVLNCSYNCFVTQKQGFLFTFRQLEQNFP